MITISQISKSLNGLHRQISFIDWEQKPTYTYYLAQMYYYKRRTPQLLSLAASSSPPDDFELRSTYAALLNGEIGYDQLLLENIQTSGFRLSEIPQAPTTQKLYESLYIILPRQPHALLGHTLCFKYLMATASPIILNCIKEFDDLGAQFLMRQITQDPLHGWLAMEQIKKMSKNEQMAIMDQFETTKSRLADFFEGLLQFSLRPQEPPIAAGK